MSLHVPYRSFNRKSQNIRVNNNTLSPTAGTFVNVDSPRVQRDLARHSSIGGFVQSGTSVGFPSDGYLDAGGKVTVRATGLVLDVTAAYFTRANGTKSSQVADTATIGAADGTNPRIDVIAIDTNTPDIVVVAGTATANANFHNKLGLVATLAANRIPIALVLVPATVTDLVQTNVVALR